MSDELWAEAILGKDAEAFLASDIGRYLIGRAKQDENEALAGLLDVKATNTEEIQNLQAKAWRARSFKGWLIGLIEAGRTAEGVLSSDEYTPPSGTATGE